MDKTPDAQLIEDYCRGSQAALATLITKHVDLVYATAFRLTRDPGLADDVTQAVFIVLAKKARSLRSHATLAGWLIIVTRHIARTAIRARERRRRHEHSAAKPEVIPMINSDAVPEALSRVLDDALASLRASDRDAIALRYLQSRSLIDVGQILGISEEAARKRVARGIERLRALLARRGVTIGATALTIGVAAFAAITAPAATVAIVTTLPTTPASALATSLSKGTLHMFAMKKTALVCGMIVLSLSAVVGISVMAQSTPVSLHAAPATAVAPLPKPITVEKPPALAIYAVALQLAVADVEANIAFFEKIGFGERFVDKPDVNGHVRSASVDSGTLRIRLYRVDTPPNPSKNFTAYFWVDGGETNLVALHDAIADRGVDVGPMSKSQTMPQFDIVTPDGYTIGFYSAAQ